MNNRITSMPPIVCSNCRVLILGSIPGEESLRKQQYYAHPRNQFWRIIYALFDLTPDEDYNKRVEFMKSKGIALWDVIGSCKREGSLDSAIKDETANDFYKLFQENPRIKHVFFNGTKAYETFRKKVGFGSFEGITFTRLCSTSPALRSTFEEKLEVWKGLKKYL